MISFIVEALLSFIVDDCDKHVRLRCRETSHTLDVTALETDRVDRWDPRVIMHGHQAIVPPLLERSTESRTI